MTETIPISRAVWALSVLALISFPSACDGPQEALDDQTATSGGEITARQAAFDVLSYNLDLEIFPASKSIAGTMTARIEALDELPEIEFDLYPKLETREVRINDAAVEFHRDDGKLIVTAPQPIASGAIAEVAVSYGGRPYVAENPPWAGGFVWSETDDGHPWIATAVQGRGCDLWWPCKDHFSDKPDVVDLRITVPAGVSVASNGVLLEERDLDDGRRVFHWRTEHPLSPYNVALNIGPYVRIQDEYDGVNGERIALEFWALPENEAKARAALAGDAKRQLAFFEKMLGPYPWADEKLGFVETPHLGMEHQTINAYGNQFKRDPHGYDWLMHHELAHEWFGNLMTHRHANDAWLHEGLASFMQPLYSEEVIGGMAFGHHLYEQFLRQKNCEPVVPDGEIDLEQAFHGGDIYSKGSWTLYTLRGLIGEEPFWRTVRRMLYDTAEPWSLTSPIRPRYRSTDDFIRIVTEEAGTDLSWFFDVYFRDAEPPELTIDRQADGVQLEWRTEHDRPFPMPVTVEVNGERTVVPMEGGRGFVAAGADDQVRIDPDLTVLRKLPIIGPCEEQSEGDHERMERQRRRQAERYGWKTAED